MLMGVLILAAVVTASAAHFGSCPAAQQPAARSADKATAPNDSPPTIPRTKPDASSESLKQMQQDADELAALAQSLQDDLAKSNQNVFSLKVVEKAEKIEKLARKIKNQARGN